MRNELFVAENIKQDIIQYLSGKLSDKEAQRLISWLHENNDHKMFFDSITNIWHSSSALIQKPEFNHELAWNEVFERIYSDQPKNKESSKILNFVKQYYKTAAVVAILLGSVYMAMVLKFSAELKSYRNRYTEFTAPKGSRSYATLPDGSKVWLNSDSKLRFSNEFGVSQRDIVLEGEAYFVVAKNKKVPFIVHTSGINITAVGTAFNVKAYKDEKTIETTLEEGSVKIEAAQSAGKGISQLMLKPKEKAIFIKEPAGTTLEKESIKTGNKSGKKDKMLTSPELKSVPVADTKLSTSWKEQRWIFRHESLEELARKLERKYDVEIIFKDSSLREFAFNGSLQDESIEQVFEVIRMVAPIDYKIEHKTIELRLNSQLQKKYEKLLSQ